MKFLRIRNQRLYSEEHGFSLLELVIVIVILGILTAISIPVYLEQQKTAIRAQVDQDVMSTAQALSQWQNAQNEFNAIPTTAVFNSKIKTATDAQTNITFSVGDWGNPNTRQFCITGTKNIGGTYQVHYNTYTKEKGTGPCPAFVEESPENYG